jgi:hypothetical protein
MVGTIMPMARYLRSSRLVISGVARASARVAVTVVGTADVVMMLSAEAVLALDPDCAEVSKSDAPRFVLGLITLHSFSL